MKIANTAKKSLTPKCSIYNVSFENLFPVILGDSLGYGFIGFISLARCRIHKLLHVIYSGLGHFDDPWKMSLQGMICHC